MYVFSNEPIQMAFAETDRSAQLYESDFSFGYPMTERPYRNAKVRGRFADGHQVRMGFYCLTNGFRCDVYFLPPYADDGLGEPALTTWRRTPNLRRLPWRNVGILFTGETHLE